MDEGSLAELQNGVLVANMRNKQKSYGVSFSSDGGETWSAVHLDPSLPSPVCEGSLLSVQDSPDLYFASPGTSAGFVNGTVMHSNDGAASWTEHVQVNPGGAFTYSSLSVSSDAVRLGLLWETSTDGCSAQSTACSIVFSQIPTA